ncbi:hypothetical protein HK102_008763 [Quaeritorhiza haematococci]|nr:hypothetical protein HK102_008763 [Quaeritorhiza haematococci]
MTTSAGPVTTIPTSADPVAPGLTFSTLFVTVSVVLPVSDAPGPVAGSQTLLMAKNPSGHATAQRPSAILTISHSSQAPDSLVQRRHPSGQREQMLPSKIEHTSSSQRPSGVKNVGWRKDPGGQVSEQLPSGSLAWDSKHRSQVPVFEQTAHPGVHGVQIPLLLKNPEGQDI